MVRSWDCFMLWVMHSYLGGLTTIPAFAGTTLWAYIVGLAISFIGGMVLTFVFGVKDPEAQMTSKKVKKRGKINGIE